MLSRGIGQGVATGIANGLTNYKTIGNSLKAIKDYSKIAKSIKLAGSPEVLEAKALANVGKWNLAGIGGQIVG
jgi:hypothetical protein